MESTQVATERESVESRRTASGTNTGKPHSNTAIVISSGEADLEAKHATRHEAGRKSSSRRSVSLEIGSGKPDLEALSALVREWIVPLLVKEFLSERMTDGSSSEASEQKRTKEPLGRSVRTIPHEFCQ
jgi:hypothetical protein